MTRMLRCLAPILLVGMAATHPGSLAAQDQVVNWAFDLSNPGARSLGLGGAFAALADDATAAHANPAGLVGLLEPEVSFEGRSWDFAMPYEAGGREAGEPTGIGIDVYPGIRYEEARSRVRGVSFVSLMYPVGGWRFALYRHQTARLDLSAEFQGSFDEEPERSPIRESVSFDFKATGAAVAYRVSDKLSIGAGVALYEGELSEDLSLYLLEYESDEQFYGEFDFSSDYLAGTSSMRVDDTGVGYNLGVLVEIPEGWRAATFYRRGPHMATEWVIRAGPLFGYPPGTLVFSTRAVKLSVPDVYGGGLSYRSPSGRLTLGFEYDKVRYSQLFDTSGVDPEAIEEPPFEFDFRDGDELHLGVELAWLDASPVRALRLGTWVESEGGRLGGDSVTHYAAGFGLAWKGVQLDIAADYSGLLTTASISTVFTF
jgi:long-chain fatty acid transport protein